MITGITYRCLVVHVLNGIHVRFSCHLYKPTILPSVQTDVRGRAVGGCSACHEHPFSVRVPARPTEPFISSGSANWRLTYLRRAERTDSIGWLPQVTVCPKCTFKLTSRYPVEVECVAHPTYVKITPHLTISFSKNGIRKR